MILSTKFYYSKSITPTEKEEYVATILLIIENRFSLL